MQAFIEAAEKNDAQAKADREKKRESAWIMYSLLICNTPEPTEGDLKKFREVCQELGIDAAKVREHQNLVAQAESLADAAARLQELEAEYVTAIKALREAQNAVRAATENFGKAKIHMDGVNDARMRASSAGPELAKLIKENPQVLGEFCPLRPHGSRAAQPAAGEAQAVKA